MPAVYDGDLLVARALIRPFTQYWGGRPLQMAGVAGVVVSPEYRGHGVGTQLMTFVARRSRELGYPVSVLYPATFSVYRRTGWEVAGVWSRVTIETRLLRDLRGGGEVVVREVGPKDAAELVAILRRRYTTDRPNGPLDSTVDELAENLGDSSVFAYATDDGFVLYGWQDRGFVVHHMVAGSLATARALWSVVGSGSSIAEKVHAYLAPDDPIHHVLGEEVDTDLRVERWMLRLIDVEAALGGRGYPVGCGRRHPPGRRGPRCSRRTGWSDGWRCTAASDASWRIRPWVTPETSSGSERTASRRCTPARRRPACRDPG